MNMKYKIQLKSWLRPIEMEAEEIALRAARRLLDYPDTWESVNEEGMRHHYASTVDVWREILREFLGEREFKSDDSCPHIIVSVHKWRQETIYAVKIVSGDWEFPEKLMFVSWDTDGLRVKRCSPKVFVQGIHGDDVCVRPDLDLAGFGGYVFTPEDPAWPLPAFYPQRFTGLIRLGKLLTAGDTNPLTGLCGARDSSYRTLAKQVAEELKAIYGQVAADIIAAI